MKLRIIIYTLVIFALNVGVALPTENIYQQCMRLYQEKKYEESLLVCKKAHQNYDVDRRSSAQSLSDANKHRNVLRKIIYSYIALSRLEEAAKFINYMKYELMVHEAYFIELVLDYQKYSNRHRIINSWLGPEMTNAFSLSFCRYVVVIWLIYDRRELSQVSKEMIDLLSENPSFSSCGLELNDNSYISINNKWWESDGDERLIFLYIYYIRAGSKKNVKQVEEKIIKGNYPLAKYFISSFMETTEKY